MPSTATPILKLEDQATGENAATWGAKTDNNLELVEQAIKSVYPYSCAASGDLTLDDTQYAANEVRRAVIRLTGSRSAAGAVIVPAREGWWFFENRTTGGYDLTVKTPAGSGVALPASGGVYGLMCDGTDVIDMELVNDDILQAELAAVSAGGFYTTSSTSNAISVAGSNLTFTTADSGKAFTPGTPLRIARTSDPANYYMDAIVTSYSGTSLGVVVGNAVGAGTFSNWSISVAGGPDITIATIIRRAVTTNDTIELGDNGGLIDVTSGSPILTLPDGATAGVGFNVRVINTGTGAPIVNCSGSDTINGAANHTFLRYQCAHFCWVGSGWTILADPRKKPLITAAAGLEVNSYYDGAVVVVQTAAVVSLGAASVVGAGFQTDIMNGAASGAVTVSRSGSDTIADSASASNTSVSLNPGVSIRVVADGSTTWRVISDTRGGSRLRNVSSNDSLVASDNGAIVRVTASGVTLGTTAAATLGAGWRCRVQCVGDYNDLFYLIINPNSSEEIDDQTQVVAYVGEEFDVYCDGTKFYTTRANGLVFFGEQAAPSATTMALYTDNVFVDDPEMVGGEIHIDGLNQDNGTNRDLYLRVYDGGSVVSSSSRYSYGYMSAYGTPAGAESSNADQVPIATHDNNNQVSGYIKYTNARASSARSGGTFVTSAVGTRIPRAGSWGFSLGEIEGFQFSLSGAGNFNAGVIRYYGIRARRA